MAVRTEHSPTGDDALSDDERAASARAKARELPKSEHTQRAISFLIDRRNAFAARAVALVEQLGDPLHELEADLVTAGRALRMARLTEQAPDTKRDLDATDGRLTAALNTIRDITQRLTDLAATLNAAEAEALEMTKRAHDRGYDVPLAQPDAQPLAQSPTDETTL